MHLRPAKSLFSKHVQSLLGVYFAASLTHFAHNAEYIAFYQNMPIWLTREKVYLAWLAITSFGIAGLVVLRLGLHTLATNLTIWFEAVTGLMLALASTAMLFPKAANLPP